MSEPLPGARYTHPGPQRRYAVPFHEVWITLLREAELTPRLRMLQADAQRGEIRLETRGLVLRTPRDAIVRVRLDELGQTCVETALAPRRGALSPSPRAGSLDRFLRRLDRRLAGA